MKTVVSVFVFCLIFFVTQLSAAVVRGTTQVQTNSTDIKTVQPKVTSPEPKTVSPLTRQPAVETQITAPKISPGTSPPTVTTPVRQPVAAPVTSKPVQIREPQIRTPVVNTTPGGERVRGAVELQTGQKLDNLALPDGAKGLGDRFPGGALREGLLGDPRMGDKGAGMNELQGPGSRMSPSGVRGATSEHLGLPGSNRTLGKSNMNLEPGGSLVDPRLSEGDNDGGPPADDPIAISDSEDDGGSATGGESSGQDGDSPGQGSAGSNSGKKSDNGKSTLQKIGEYIFTTVNPNPKDTSGGESGVGIRGITNPEDGTGGGLRGQEIVVPVTNKKPETGINTLVDDFSQSGKKTDRSVPEDQGNDPLIITSGEQSGPTATGGSSTVKTDVRGSLTDPDDPDLNLTNPATGQLPGQAPGGEKPGSDGDAAGGGSTMGQ